MGPDNFVKVQLWLASHPTVLALGHCVDHVFTLLLRISRETRNDGTLHADFLTPTILRKRFGIGQDLLDSYLDRGIEGVLSGGLVERVDDKTARIVDWHEHYPIPAKTSTERSRAFRDRIKAPATDATNATNATFHETRDGCSNDATGIRGEEIRGEERRLEEKRTTSPPYPPPVDDNPILVGSPCEPTTVEVDENARGVAEVPEGLARVSRGSREEAVSEAFACWGSTFGIGGPRLKRSTAAGKARAARVRARVAEHGLDLVLEVIRYAPRDRWISEEAIDDLGALMSPKLFENLASRCRNGTSRPGRVEPEYVDPFKTEMERIRRGEI